MKFRCQKLMFNIIWDNTPNSYYLFLLGRKSWITISAIELRKSNKTLCFFINIIFGERSFLQNKKLPGSFISYDSRGFMADTMLFF